jgi:hypothetical protein
LPITFQPPNTNLPLEHCNYIHTEPNNHNARFANAHYSKH